MEEYMRNTFGFEALRHVFNDSSSDVRRKILGIYLVLILFNVVIWALVLLGFAPYPALYGTAALGFFFGLGHATIVLILGIIVAVSAALLKVDLQLQSVAGAVGTSVSALFLYLIAFLNLIVLVDIFRTFRKIQRGESYSEQTLNEVLNQRGFLARFF